MSYNSSPARNFSDFAKKTQIINELKKEILEQKQKEEEYEELFNEVKILETKIDNLALKLLPNGCQPFLADIILFPWNSTSWSIPK